MSNINTDLLEGILQEKYPSIPHTMVSRMVKHSCKKSFDQIMEEVETMIEQELYKEILPPRKHIMDFERKW